MMAALYIQVRQKDILTQLNVLRENLEQNNLKLSVWRKYWSLNSKLMQIATDTKEYSKFYAPFLTILFPYYVFEQCYLLYLIAFPRKEVTFKENYVFYLVWAELASSFFLLITCCARVVDNFDKAIVLNRKFNIELQQRAIFVKHGRETSVNITDMLKAEASQLPRRFQGYSFRLSLINYRITSKTFSSMIGYISIFFMYVYKGRS